MGELPKITVIYPIGTEDNVSFSKEVKRYASGSNAAALEKSLTFLSCDQGKPDILKNVALLEAAQPDVVILCPSMKEETLEIYSEKIFNLRPPIRTSDVTKLLIYHYDYQSHADPERELADTVDEYFPTAMELIQALLNTLFLQRKQ